MISYYGIHHLITWIEENKVNNVEEIQNIFSKKMNRSEWFNAGGQLIEKKDLDNLRKEIREGKIKSWDHLHNCYEKFAKNYLQQKIMHANASLFEIKKLESTNLNKEVLNKLFTECIETKEWITKEIYQSRAKDYSNPFRKIVYTNDDEMDKVLGKLDENSFISAQQKEFEIFKNKIDLLKKRLKLE